MNWKNELWGVWARPDEFPDWKIEISKSGSGTWDLGVEINPGVRRYFGVYKTIKDAKFAAEEIIDLIANRGVL